MALARFQWLRAVRVTIPPEISAYTGAAGVVTAGSSLIAIGISIRVVLLPNIQELLRGGNPLTSSRKNDTLA